VRQLGDVDLLIEAVKLSSTQFTIGAPDLKGAKNFFHANTNSGGEEKSSQIKIKL
jgi:hypothetical protein